MANHAIFLQDYNNILLHLNSLYQLYNVCIIIPDLYIIIMFLFLVRAKIPHHFQKAALNHSINHKQLLNHFYGGLLMFQ